MKNIIITGGTGYLGEAVTSVLSEAGFTVISKRIDVTNEKEVEKYAKEVNSKYGEIFALIHAVAAPLHRKKVLEESAADFIKQFDVIVTGAFHVSKHFCPLLASGGAVIGVLSKSITDKTKHSPSGSYIPAKYGLRGLLRVIGEELGQNNVRVYGVAPAFMAGGLNSDIPQVVAELIAKKSQPEDITTPEEVARVILRLIRDEKASMNGKLITIPESTLTDL